MMFAVGLLVKALIAFLAYKTISPFKECVDESFKLLAGHNDNWSRHPFIRAYDFVAEKAKGWGEKFEKWLDEAPAAKSSIQTQVDQPQQTQAADGSQKPSVRENMQNPAPTGGPATPPQPGQPQQGQPGGGQPRFRSSFC